MDLGWFICKISEKGNNRKERKLLQQLEHVRDYIIVHINLFESVVLITLITMDHYICVLNHYGFKTKNCGSEKKVIVEFSL